VGCTDPVVLSGFATGSCSHARFGSVVWLRDRQAAQVGACSEGGASVICGSAARSEHARVRARRS
jgi:hypothetical protein